MKKPKITRLNPDIIQLLSEDRNKKIDCIDIPVTTSMNRAIEGKCRWAMVVKEDYASRENAIAYILSRDNYASKLFKMVSVLSQERLISFNDCLGYFITEDHEKGCAVWFNKDGTHDTTKV